MNAVKKYIAEAVHELRQVQWPTQNHAMRISTITAIFILVSTVFIAFVDFVLNEGLLFSQTFFSGI